MSFAFIATATGLDDASGTTLDTSASLNVATGDVLVAWCKHNGAATTFAVAKNSGTPTNAFTFDAGDAIAFSNTGASFGYLLVAAADATATFRLTLGAARDTRHFLVLQFRPDSGTTITKDASSDATGTGTAPNSGNITTTGTDEVVVGGFAESFGITTSSELINGAGATEPSGSPQGGTSVWYGLLTAAFSGGAATATISSNDWLCGVIAIKAVVSTPLAGTLTQTVPTTSTSTTGWTVGTTAAGNYSRLSYSNEVAAVGFSTTVQPSGPPSSGAQDCFRSTASLLGQFRAGWWTSSVSVIGVTSGGDADGRVRVNILKSATATGESAITLTTMPMVGTLVTNLSTSVAQTSTASGYIDTSNFTNEYLFVQLAWEITGAGAAADRDVLVRFGNMGLTSGSGLITSEFSDLRASGGGGSVFGTGYFFRRRRLDAMCAYDEV